MKKLLASLIGIALLISLTGCILGPRDEKQAFIDATVKATCHIFQAKNLFDPKLEQEAKDIYKEYGFPSEDQTQMQTIADKYSADEAVKTAIMDQVKECSKGVPGLEGLQNPAPATETPAADGTKTTPPATTAPATTAPETTPAPATTPAPETAK